METIKFRAWHETAKEMLLEDFIGDALKWKREGQPVKVMQFIGQHDKNGKEIYEGDVVSLVAIEDEIKHWETATRASVEWDDQDAGFFYAAEYDKFPHIKPWFAKDVEVIGNIYENPELRPTLQSCGHT